MERDFKEWKTARNVLYSYFRQVKERCFVWTLSCFARFSFWFKYY